MNVSFNDLHANPQNSQLITCLTGSPEFILDKLKEMVNEIETSVDRRPHQGQLNIGAGRSQVKVTMWSGVRVNGDAPLPQAEHAPAYVPPAYGAYYGQINYGPAPAGVVSSVGPAGNPGPEGPVGENVIVEEAIQELVVDEQPVVAEEEVDTAE